MSAHKELTYLGWDVEFDTVIGRKGGKCLLTFVLLPSTLFFARLIDKKDQASVCAEFDHLERIFKRYRTPTIGQSGIWWFFSSALTDRGSEMSDYQRLERSLYPIEDVSGDVIEKRCKVYYCDPYSSWQKPHIEEAHTLLRRVLPKGVSFDGLTQKDIDLICSHINSYSRKRLAGATPFEITPAGFTDELNQALGLSRIDPDKVCLTPRLLDR